jgi:glyoxylase-like metal-dependent hydrolase (beta-lactamase superfamily II)
MQLEQHVAPGIHRIEDAFTNWYLVEDGGRLTVVDSGLPASWGSLLQVLERLGHRPEAIEAVVLTHGHFDHVGFADRAHRDLGVPVYAHVDERHLVAHPWDYDHEHSRARQALDHPGFVKVFAAMGAAGALWTKGTSETEDYLADETLDVPGRPRVIPTPGHTYGHCSLFFADRGTLLAGDAFVTFNPYTTGSGPQIVSGAATADSERALRSLDALEAVPADIVGTGHGPVWRGPVAEACARAREAGPS